MKEAQKKTPLFNTTPQLIRKISLLAMSFTLLVSAARGQILDQTPTRVQTSLKPGFSKLGTLIPKSVPQIKTSMWSLGCETLDRNLANWDVYKAYLIPLGIQHIRLQGGWARTEKVRGIYDFQWLDHIVDDAQALGLKVCLETSYGNRLYDPKALINPGGLMPEGPEYLAAWDKWVEAMARHYSAKGVNEWMMFNEPNLNKGNTIEKITEFNVRTAQIIKQVDPAAQIGGGVFAGPDGQLIGSFLRQLKEQGKANLFEWLIYHSYARNPDGLEGQHVTIEKLWSLVHEYTPNLRLWQGESGCASELVQFALGEVNWSELTQAKWNARRMLGDLGHDVRSSVFTISDLSYDKNFISRYGLLKTDSSNAVIKVKIAYYAVQNIVSVFNDALERTTNTTVEVQSDKKIAHFAYRDKATGLSVITFWDKSGVPSDECILTKALLTVKNAHFKEPAWVDVITGDIYAIPAERMVAEGDSYVFKDIPVYDAPTVIIDKSLLSFVPVRKIKNNWNQN
jgi:hypothetical protein